MPFEVKCPHCGSTLEAEEEIAGETLPCPACQQPIAVLAAGAGKTTEQPEGERHESDDPREQPEERSSHAGPDPSGIKEAAHSTEPPLQPEAVAMHLEAAHPSVPSSERAGEQRPSGEPVTQPGDGTRTHDARRCGSGSLASRDSCSR